MADAYLAAKPTHDPDLEAALHATTAGVPPGGPVLDLGCGAGVPATAWLAARFTVTGVDISARQIELARQRLPGARLLHADLAGPDLARLLPAASFDAIIALYALIHIPRSEHPTVLGRIHAWLRPGGAFLATWPMTAWEGSEDDWEGWGAPMWWSHHGADANLALLRSAGFTVEDATPRTQGGETWLWVRARRGEAALSGPTGDERDT